MPSSQKLLTLELERLSLRAVRRVYDDLNASLFEDRLRLPAFELSDADGRLGRWSGARRTLELRRTLLVEHGWGVLVEVLKHEMAHQFVSEVLGVEDEPDHGPVFRQVCEERAIDARAAGAPTADRVRDHVLDRIAKLLALAESPNEHEAQAAMSAAQRLMLKHNIDSLLEGKRRAYGFKHLGTPSGRIQESERLLAGILGDHFFVQVIWVPVWRPLDGKRGSVLEVCGSPDNLELAEYVHAFVTQTADRLWQEYRRGRTEQGRSDRPRFLAGVMSGFRNRLERDKKKNGADGLVWKGDGDLPPLLPSPPSAHSHDPARGSHGERSLQSRSSRRSRARPASRRSFGSLGGRAEALAAEALAANAKLDAALRPDQNATTLSDPTPDSAAADPHLGTVLAGRYRVTKALGSGGMGVVYRAEHVHMKKVVAVKILHKHMTAMPEVVARFEREAVAAGRIEHPNVAGATDFGRLDDGSFYLALEYIEGRSLSSLLERGGALPAVRALLIARQIADGLAAAHAAGIIHRDLKPENVMLVERDGMSDWVKVLDFGIAKVPVEEGDGPKLTQIGTIFGTPQYMSPEQGQGHTVNARADLYALGVMLYEMLAGKLPFTADDMVVLITRHILEAPPPLSDGIHPAVRALVSELLEKDPSHRIQTAGNVVEQIDRLLKNPAIAPVGSIPPAVLGSGPPGSLGHARTALGVPTARFDHRLLVAKLKRAVRDEFPARLRRVHRALLRPMRLGRQELPRYALLGAVLIAALPPLVLLVVKSGGPAAALGDRHADPLGDTAKAPSADSDDEKRAKLVLRAEGGDREALTALEAIPTRDRRAQDWRALAHGRCAVGDNAACIAGYKAAVLGAPTLKRDPTVLADVRRLAENDVVYEDALRLAAHHLNENGVDILFDVWTTTRSRKDAQALTRRARQFLDDGSVRDHASRELRLVLDLERVEKKRRCKDAPDLVKKAGEYADERAVAVLDKLAAGRGCGLLSLGDCWSCLRGNKDLTNARAAAAGRKGPSWNGDGN